MTDKVWFGGIGEYYIASNWSPSGVPSPGDSIMLGTGTLDIKNANLINIPITMGSYTGAYIKLHDSILGDVGLTTVPTPTGQVAGNHTFDVSDNATFAGTISTDGSGGTEFADNTTINVDAYSELTNIGNIELTPQEGATLNIKGLTGATLVNDGLIEVESGPGVTVKIGPDVLGFGTIEIGVGAATAFATPTGSAEFEGSVSTAQTFAFSGALGATASDLLLKIDEASAFGATIANFGGTDTIELAGTTVTSENFSNGVLALKDGSDTVAHLHFSGSYTTSDFATQVVGGDTLIKFA
jgi:hypothetical protein